MDDNPSYLLSFRCFHPALFTTKNERCQYTLLLYFCGMRRTLKRSGRFDKIYYLLCFVEEKRISRESFCGVFCDNCYFDDALMVSDSLIYGVNT